MPNRPKILRSNPRLLSRHGLAFALSTVLCVAVLAFLGTFARSYEECIARYRNSDRIDSSLNAPKATLSRFIRCEGAFLDANDVLITAIATGFIAWFTFALRRSTDNLAEATTAIADRQSKELKIIQRAYLSVSPDGIRPYRSGDAYLACSVVIENSGGLPAKNVRWFINREFDKDPARSDFPVPDTDAEFHGRNLIPAKGKMIKGGPAIPRAEYLIFRDGGRFQDRWLYVWGRIFYSDGFSDVRHIDFCHRYNLLGEKDLTIPAENGRMHEYGNHTDEE